jgi:hypothetical protein
MLFCQQFGRRHDRRLEASFHCTQRCKRSDDRLTASHIALHEP